MQILFSAIHAKVLEISKCFYLNLLCHFNHFCKIVIFQLSVNVMILGKEKEPNDLRKTKYIKYNYANLLSHASWFEA